MIPDRHCAAAAGSHRRTTEHERLCAAAVSLRAAAVSRHGLGVPGFRQRAGCVVTVKDVKSCMPCLHLHFLISFKGKCK